MPIPFILFNCSKVKLDNSSKLSTLLSNLIAKSLDDSNLLPVLSSIASNSSLERESDPLFINLSIGLSKYGISLIFFI